ncbi:1,6-dihydroxycyclohexa-2,4-diene-1-carboxylate dehydrogenase [Arthrobacter sp. MYb224]|uniref:1,6-dihydroxycyclohexa-2,4-diene-1-carboxylate dehydrogenase n=1 Tax=Micrococcaceae TaxID=1268 RepID=UPI000CFAE877|nr:MULTISPECIES: 1,6-dihydroxycyclohexa-2,4-diene-1-carboxylate dehydrogenase [unclassified Arthrobacter]PQZ98875.1 1,6-dihydroxycyclohexa-2,4-diene-1-carboxylate dehydrogenase [Arthrobacter sp. MYb224]PRA03213.1 1,6-dihydroxycyclohexa-2,4-diene-1-carboxylate dehydrogenase [Arthrobacter sp. MYb229]PRB49683.1 1,6-dihydroxycyclohexa-2,4-diene-1-carboxylate dehydrogenase [Arthrobacter sp. MYb216]
MSADNAPANETAAAGYPESFHPGRFAGQVVMVTGAAQGIGWSVARRIAAEGGELVLVDRAGLIHDVAEGLRAHGAHALSVTADLETYAGALAAVTAAMDEFGRIDVLINNVGGTIWAKPYEHYAPEEISKEIQRSLFPTLWMCRAAFEEMVKAGSGTIVNVSSVATRGVNRVPYAAAKGGVKAITSALAMEGAAHGIRVVATAPGGTEAPERVVKRGPAPTGEQEKAWYQSIVDQTVDSTLLKRYGTLDEQSAPIVFLASDEASYITGATLAVAGGDLG